MFQVPEQDTPDLVEATASKASSASPRSLSWKQVITSVFRDLLEATIPALIIALLITQFVGERTVVLGQSMEPNLHQDQQLIVDKLSYRLHSPRRGDIVIIDVEESEIPYIKRVVGLPGETVEIRNNRVFIDGKVLEEPYLSQVTSGAYGPITIPSGHVFVLGDNRGNSRDSRALGPVPFEHIIARAWVSVWPVEDIHLLK